MINTLTILEAIEGLKTKKFSSVDLVNSCYTQIDKYDSKIKAFVTLTKESALESAKKADQILAEKGADAFSEFPLLGIPYACKDNYNTEGVQTTASSNVLKGYIPPYESTVTKRLKDAGAILLGKTNMDAFAHGSSTETSDFFKTTNPWNYKKVPGGSSGGSAAAVAADMCIFATGSETAGSIRGPAAWCGITGIKPTYGRVSRYGLIAMASSTDSPGPLVKNALDAGYILNIIAGKDPFDATSSPLPTDDYYKLMQQGDLKGVRIGKPRSYFEIELESGVRERTEEAIETFKELGAQIVDMDLLSPKYSIAVYTILQRSEVSSNLARLDGIRYGNDRTNFGFEAKKRMMLGAYALSAGYYDQYYAKAQKVRTEIVNDFKKAFNDVDLIVGPTMPCVAMDLGESDKSPMFGELMDVLAEPSSIAGINGISIPCGLSGGMPVGLQIMANMFEETKILRAANRFQQVTNYHKVKAELK
ncbi:Asp-tRNA(Asn)/Glu-tRNA(Gln) amidotransferase subunit GatA [candidate division WWE3 bacterium]|uniref:Glutamyl-tRNA(Gln) amidotransferase subunit A n=1 Tax=candidate division WWE3 bacterium TaxID=2053526 RepID=A0A7X9DKI4_UNCKA|nr:Asp-tRNA(Asn)/Glu-tRNA(Gln) amidotransferase subunit GatA [candidate division WWE3 bacterium]